MKYITIIDSEQILFRFYVNYFLHTIYYKGGIEVNFFFEEITVVSLFNLPDEQKLSESDFC